MLLVEFQISTANVENSMQVPQTVKNKTITCAKSLQSSRTLCNAMDYSLSGSFVHGILQARTLECVATHSPRRSSQPGIKPYLLSLLYWQADSLTLVPSRQPLELPYVPTILLLREGNKITISKRYMYHHVHCSIIYNNQNGNNLCPLTLNQYVDAQVLSYVWLFVTPWTAAHQAFLSFIISQSLLKLMSIESVLPSNHLVFCYPLSSCLQSFPASGSFLMNWLYTSGGQSIGA